MTVELKDFVTQTLLDILKGVSDAGLDQTVGRRIAPTEAIVRVKFDVAVTAESTDTAKAGGGFKVAVLGIGASAGADLGTASKNVAVTRIQFEVPVLLPAGDKKKPGV
jgi:hypothetical protein